MKPVLRTVASNAAGNIRGTITPIGSLAVVSATSSSNVVHCSSVNTLGQFQISGLHAGVYTVTATPTLPLLPVTQAHVTVTANASTSLTPIAF